MRPVRIDSELNSIKEIARNINLINEKCNIYQFLEITAVSYFALIIPEVTKSYRFALSYERCSV